MKHKYLYISISIIFALMIFSSCIKRTTQSTTINNPQTGETYHSFDKENNWYQNPNTGETLHKFGDDFYQNPNTGEIYYGN